MPQRWRATSSVLAAALLGGCALPPPTPAPADAPAGGVVIRYFDGVLVLPPGYVFDGTALPDQVRFEGPGGALRLGHTAQLGPYLEQAQRSAQSRDTICGLDVLRHGDGEPPLFLLRAGDAYALVHDRDPGVVRRLVEVYCASTGAD